MKLISLNHGFNVLTPTSFTLFLISLGTVFPENEFLPLAKRNFSDNFLIIIYQVIQRAAHAGQPGSQPHKEEAWKKQSSHTGGPKRYPNILSRMWSVDNKGKKCSEPEAGSL